METDLIGEEELRRTQEPSVEELLILCYSQWFLMYPGGSSHCSMAVAMLYVVPLSVHPHATHRPYGTNTGMVIRPP